MLNNKEIVLYHANWCGHCEKYLPKWEDFMKQINEHKSDIQEKYNVNVSAKKYEETDPKNKSIFQEKKIESYPTIHINNVQYEGNRHKFNEIIKTLIPNISAEHMESWFNISDTDTDIEKSEKVNANPLEDKLEDLMDKLNIKIGGNNSDPVHQESISFYKYLKYKEKYHNMTQN